MFKYAAVPALCLFLIACASKPGGPHATVVMRDGTSAAGTVVEASASQIKLAGDDNQVRTIPMNQVRSVNYDEVAAPPPRGAAPAPAAPPAEVAHEQHYHP